MDNLTKERETRTWFVLGREPLLSTAEILALLPALPRPQKAIFFTPALLRVSGDFSAANLMPRLGGTIKIARELVANKTEKQVLEAIISNLKSQSGKIIFGLSWYGQHSNAAQIESWGKKLKKTLKEEGRSVRYVFTGETALSSVTVAKNGLLKNGIEFLITNDKENWSLAQTTAIQPFESFSARDYGRPGRDSLSGMLPPKLAMMLINLSRAKQSDTLLDPFCGSGTIITEALLLGFKNVFGSDLSAKAIADSEQNLEWQTKVNKMAALVKLQQQDVRTLSTIVEPHSITAIVTEPFLGEARHLHRSEDEARREAESLARLYMEAFAEFKKILRPEGKVVFVIPRFETSAGPVRVADLVIPALGKLGFVPSALLPTELHRDPFILYRRPDQKVGREIWRFSFKKVLH